MYRLSSLLALTLSLVWAVGCSEEVTPAEELDAFYTLWGGFNPQSDQQQVRVVPVTRSIGLGSPDPLPITVTSVDLVTNAEVTWADTVIAFADGSFGHVYRAALTPAFGSRHLFTVRQDNGRETTALVSVPQFVTPIRQATDMSFGVVYAILWPDAPRLNRVRATYTVGLGPDTRLVLENALQPSLSGPVEFGWQTRLNLRTQADELAPRLESMPFTICRIDLQAEVASEDWRPPGGVFDPDILIEPGTLSNVSNGFGFVGSAFAQAITWTPSPDELSRANLRPRTFGCN